MKIKITNKQAERARNLLQRISNAQHEARALFADICPEKSAAIEIGNDPISTALAKIVTHQIIHGEREVEAK